MWAVFAWDPSIWSLIANCVNLYFIVLIEREKQEKLQKFNLWQYFTTFHYISNNNSGLVHLSVRFSQEFHQARQYTQKEVHAIVGSIHLTSTVKSCQRGIVQQNWISIWIILSLCLFDAATLMKSGFLLWLLHCLPISGRILLKKTAPLLE